jgi:hypothetical protein
MLTCEARLGGLLHACISGARFQQPSGYTEPLPHAWRLKAKAATA